MTLHDVAVRKQEELICLLAANYTLRIIVYLEDFHGHQMVVCGIILGYKVVWLLSAGCSIVWTFARLKVLCICKCV